MDLEKLYDLIKNKNKQGEIMKENDFFEKLTNLYLSSSEKNISQINNSIKLNDTKFVFIYFTVFELCYTLYYLNANNYTIQDIDSLINLLSNKLCNKLNMNHSFENTLYISENMEKITNLIDKHKNESNNLLEFLNLCKKDLQVNNLDLYDFILSNIFYSNIHLIETALNLYL